MGLKEMAGARRPSARNQEVTMNPIKYFLSISLICGVLFAGAQPTKAKLTPCTKSTGDEIILTHGHSYLGGSRSPGDSIGMTGLEYQANGGCEKRIAVDDSFQVHILWMKVPFPFSNMAQRRMEWNFRFNDGSYFGEVDASPFTSGYGSLDLTQDATVNMQRSVISYHFSGGTNEYYPYMDIDDGNGFGAFPNNPVHPPNSHNCLWPMVAATKNNNFILVTDDNAGNFHHCFVTTDYGVTWTNPFNSDSAACISMFVMASRMSNKVAFVETRFITDSAAIGQLDNNVWYRLSTDGGETWGPHINLTNYQPTDSFRAYCNVSCIFDQNDNLHIVWPARYIYQGGYYDASKIMHWDELHNLISVVSQSTGIFSGGWWGWTNPNGYGAWRLPADEPLMTVNRSTGVLYTLWCGQNDTTDFSLGGFPNGDIYIASSYDGGLTWSGWRNLTNTHTPGAATGACEDEDYLAVCPYMVRDSIFMTYIEDKDAGAITQTEGDTTDNPVRLYVWRYSPGIDDDSGNKTENTKLMIRPIPAINSSNIFYRLSGAAEISLKLFDISGYLVNILDQGVKEAGNHTVKIKISDLPAGTYFIVLKEGDKTRTAKLVKAR